MGELSQEELYKKEDVADNMSFVKCPSCGGNLGFDPETQMLKCEHCGTTIDFEKDRKVKEQDIELAFQNSEKWSEAQVFRCSNCGATVVMTSSDVSKGCPYCGTPHVQKTEDMVGIKPNAVYPFILTKEKAFSGLKNWLKHKFFAPNKLKKRVDVEDVHGVYEPCFTFDSHTYSVYNGRIGVTRTRTVRRNGKLVTESYTEYRNISGTYADFFDDVFISSGNTMGQNLLNKLSPYDYSTIKVYAEKYLSGFTAKHYDKDVKDCWNDAKTVMDKELKRRILSNYHYDSVQYLNVSTTHEGVTYKYVLVPVYVLNYTYNGKLYHVYVNGNTGKISGKSPVSWVKVLLTVLGIGAVIGLIGLCYYFKTNGM